MKLGVVSCFLIVSACSEPTALDAPLVSMAPGAASLDKLSTTAPLEVFVTNPCNGEFVLVTGETDVVIFTSAKANGKTDVRTDQRDRGTGVGYPSGTMYTYDSKTSGSFSSADPYPLHITTHNNIKLNAKNSVHADDFTATIRTVTHINSQGTITQDRTVEKSSCGSGAVPA